MKDTSLRAEGTAGANVAEGSTTLTNTGALPATGSTMLTNTTLPAEGKRQYSPADTAAVRHQTIRDIVSTQAALIQRAPVRTDLNDLDAVRVIAEQCMRTCAEVGCLPNFECLAAGLGYSRRGIYDFCERHSNTPTAEYLDRIRTLWASMRQMAADREAANPTMSIFVLLNSSLGFSNVHNLEISTPRNPADDPNGLTAQDIDRIVSALPDVDEEGPQ